MATLEAVGAAQLLSPALRHEIEPRLAALRAPLAERAISDYTFSNLFLFQRAHDYRYLPGEYPCIAGTAYDGTAHLLPLFDITTVAGEVLEELLGTTQCLFPVPAEWAARLDSTRFECHALRDDADYLFPIEQFVAYEHHELRGKRTALRNLQSSHVITTAAISPATVDDALAVLDGWCEDKGFTRLQADGGPCEQALAGVGEVAPLPGFIYYADGAPAGFVLTEMLNPGVQAVRFAKGRVSFDGIYPFMFHDLSRRQGGATAWFNFEQDLGNPGFRRSKLSYMPGALLDKYRVRRKSTTDVRKSAARHKPGDERPR
ncbi:phosphatidylglycerol lysyltransferase domain-containing protein [Steroidobacter sp.]|uniref:phosphatidylglycerol lysyltransferase domain-containing protein n=1 Tax=Steroidobacter sp. TaxID=1978227 RepID=UPI001A5BAD9F|nr:phosphatidylglycerol lysyltransferase domain-containing protein [Steroidobacter sp.]MBL8265345.1 DUF2156 domain-containing protein [Steroidobacter sp.]